MKRLVSVLLTLWSLQVFAIGDEGDDSGFGDDWGMDEKPPGAMPGVPNMPPPGGFPQPNGMQPPGGNGSLPPPPPPEPSSNDRSYGGAPPSTRGETSSGAVKFHLTGDKKKIERPKTWKEKIYGPRWTTPDPQPQGQQLER